MFNDQNLQLASQALTLIIVLFTIVFTFGVVWRVEKKLDLSFKLFLIALILFFASEIFKDVPSLICCLDLTYYNWGENLAKLLSSVFFLTGMLEMRGMIRKLDGEK